MKKGRWSAGALSVIMHKLQLLVRRKHRCSEFFRSVVAERRTLGKETANPLGEGFQKQILAGW